MYLPIVISSLMWSAQNIRIQSYKSRTVNNPIPIPFMVSRVNKVYFYLMNFNYLNFIIRWYPKAWNPYGLVPYPGVVLRVVKIEFLEHVFNFLPIYSQTSVFTSVWIGNLTVNCATIHGAKGVGPWIGQHHHRAQRSTGVRYAPSSQFTPWLLKKYTLSIYSEKE